MAQTMVNTRMDEDLKRSMEQLCQELGMDMTTAFTMIDPFYSEANLAHLRRGMKKLNEGKGTEHEIIEAEEQA